MIGIQSTSCALYGATTYTNAFLGINYLVILAGFAIISLIYLVSRFLPPSMAGRVTGITKVEAVELTISAMIISILLVLSITACGISSSLSTAATGSSSSPFLYADQYIGNLTFNSGLTILTNVYSYSIGYAIDGAIYSGISNELADYLLPASALDKIPAGPLTIGIKFPIAYNLGILYSIMSNALLALVAPLIVISLGMLFVQWISLPLIQATAFVVVLPVAIAMRSFAYAGAGPGLRTAANSVLAIAIAAYLVYPVTISFDPCIMSWIYGQAYGPQPSCLSTANPSASYLPQYPISSLPAGEFSNLGSGTYQTSGFPITTPAISSYINFATQAGLPALTPLSALSDLQPLIDATARFLFISIFLFSIDITITLACAMGIARALNAGIEGPVRFWS